VGFQVVRRDCLVYRVVRVLARWTRMMSLWLGLDVRSFGWACRGCVLRTDVGGQGGSSDIIHRRAIRV
jgi:hypothetical protein